MVKFVNEERLKNVTIDSDLCLALRTASVDNILLTDPSLNVYSESLIEKMLKMNALEKFIWKLVLFINNSQSDQLIPSINEFNELSTEDQLFVRYFIRDDLLAFSDNRVEVLDKLFELFGFFFKDEISDLYSLAVLQNCSSNKKVQILEAQKNVDTLESVLTIEQVAEGRIVYLANRVRHIEKEVT